MDGGAQLGIFHIRWERIVCLEGEAPERLRADGSVHTPLDEASVRNAIAAAKARGAEGIVISFLHGFRNAAHEAEAAKIVRETTPELFVFTSAEIWPVIREYERTTTAIINGYVHPRVSDYLDKLQEALPKIGVSAEPLITKSNGGVMSAELGKTSCVNMVLSGTASGVIGGAFVSRTCSVDNAITLDIGGTSADVAVVIGGEFTATTKPARADLILEIALASQ